MLKSMTGYGRSEFVDENFELTFEIKSVNHKFLDIQVKMPYFLNFCEENIKNVVREKLSRGRVDIYIKGNQKFSDDNSDLEINYSLAKAYCDAYYKLSEYLKLDSQISIGNIIKNDNVIDIKSKSIDEEKLRNNVNISICKAIEELITMRVGEGENLEKDLSFNLNNIIQNLEKIKSCSSEILEYQIEKLKTKLKEYSKELSDNEINRLNLEIIFYTDKLDISEEIARLQSHIDNFKKYLKTDSPIGKKLEFLVQEMNREVNTISSKSNNYNISTYVIEMKVSIEKLREQIQNIE